MPYPDNLTPPNYQERAKDICRSILRRGGVVETLDEVMQENEAIISAEATARWEALWGARGESDTPATVREEWRAALQSWAQENLVPPA